MKREMTFLDAFKLLKELSYLQEGRIRDVRSRKNELLLMIYKDREYWLRLVPGKFFCMQYNKPEDTISFPFTQKLKELLLNRKIRLSLHGSDRILNIDMDSYGLTVELFSKGNIILTQDGRIIWSMFTRRYGTREIRSGQDYAYPPSKMDITSIDYDGFKRGVLSSDRENIVKTMAMDFSFGGVYAEELIFRADIRKDSKPGEIEEEGISRLYGEFKRILFEEVKPNIIDDEILSVIELRHIEGERRYYDSINDAVKAFFDEKKTQIPMVMREEAALKTLEKYKRD
ncbi:MAG: NFACT family protein, partial [Candidatus Parvarchaeota archaeon]|nr:NFACT family protein [Candidatus Parvarchaeota archaeon]